LGLKCIETKRGITKASTSRSQLLVHAISKWRGSAMSP
jgi:hypothetical protein